jgi:lysozyme
MKIGSKALDIVKYYEGFRAKAYICPAGVWTIGYGSTKGVKKGQVINEATAVSYLARDFTEFENVVNKLVKVPLNQDQFDALVTFVYNVGPQNFKTSTLLKLLNSGDYASVPAQMKRWNKGGGKVLDGLVKRRASEGVLFSTGKIQLF